MNTSEYLAFLPLLIYGIALAELLSQWKRFFDKDQLYLPYFLATIIFTEVAIWNVFSYLDVVRDVTDIEYIYYWVHLLPPLLFLLTVNALTPAQDDKDTERYFKKRISIIFGLMALFIACHFLPGLNLDTDLDVARFAGAILCAVIAVTRKVSLVYFLSVIWLISLFNK